MFVHAVYYLIIGQGGILMQRRVRTDRGAGYADSIVIGLYPVRGIAAVYTAVYDRAGHFYAVFIGRLGVGTAAYNYGIVQRTVIILYGTAGND